MIVAANFWAIALWELHLNPVDLAGQPEKYWCMEALCILQQDT